MVAAFSFRKYIRPGHDQRNFDGFLVKSLLPPQPTFTDLIAMIRAIDHQCVVIEAGLFQLVEEAPDHGVHFFDECIIGNTCLEDIVCSEIRCFSELPPLFEVWM